MNKQFEPMGATKVTEEQCKKLRYPVLVTPKLDGIRCVIRGGRALTKSLKPVPNDQLRSILEEYCHDGLDGEIIICDEAYKPLPYNDIQAFVMAKRRTLEEYHYTLTYAVFDMVKGNQWDRPYKDRMEDLITWAGLSFVNKILPVKCNDFAALKLEEERAVYHGYEGICIRDPNGPYKFGRSTVREGWLLKLKRFEDSEAEIIDFEEKMHNANEATIGATGRMERSSHKSGLVPAGTLGALIVRDIKTGGQFSVGSGFTDAQRADIWARREELKGKLIVYKFQPSGVKDSPRFPTFKGFRDKIDMN